MKQLSEDTEKSVVAGRVRKKTRIWSIMPLMVSLPFSPCGIPHAKHNIA